MRLPLRGTGSAPIPASYAQSRYHAEHAFRFTAADGTSRLGRYHFIPEAGEAYLSPDDAGKRSPNFLRDELDSRLRRGPATFRLLLQVAAPSDATDDPTALWPADRPQVELGRLELISSRRGQRTSAACRPQANPSTGPSAAISFTSPALIRPSNRPVVALHVELPLGLTRPSAR